MTTTTRSATILHATGRVLQVIPLGLIWVLRRAQYLLNPGTELFQDVTRTRGPFSLDAPELSRDADVQERPWE